NSKGVFWVSIIARTAFSMVAVPTLTNHHCAFTLANNFNNSGPNYNSAEEIMDSKLAGRPAAETARQSSPEPEPESEPIPVY
ncbi:19590_t:CDS:2, partial [Gigaspora rosea]